MFYFRPPCPKPDHPTKKQPAQQCPLPDIFCEVNLSDISGLSYKWEQALPLERLRHLSQHPSFHLHLPLQLRQEGRQTGDLWNRGNDAPEHKEPFEGINFKTARHASVILQWLPGLHYLELTDLQLEAFDGICCYSKKVSLKFF